ncbi:MAG: hypothetical protein ACRDYB_16115, partial [Acidimicrobiales bacterium]
PSSVHKRALRGYGLSAIHRRSWAFVSGIPWGDGRGAAPPRRALDAPVVATELQHRAPFGLGEVPDLSEPRR